MPNKGHNLNLNDILINDLSTVLSKTSTKKPIFCGQTSFKFQYLKYKIITF